MKIQLPAHAMLKNGYIILKETCNADCVLVTDLFRKKAEWEDKHQKEYILQVHLDLAYQKRTFKQNCAVWVLVTAIFESMEGRKPTEEEKYDLYLDLLELYADKIPNRLTGGLRPVHISESNSLEGARFIDGLLSHLATMSDLDYDTQSTVVSVMQEWEAWKGTLTADPGDYTDIACTQPVSEAEWREKHPYSQASGKGGTVVMHHLITRGSNAQLIDKPFNWVALTPEEHGVFHNEGVEAFFARYPHLSGRYERAQRLAVEAMEDN